MPNAIVMTGYGPPEVLKWTGVPLREPGAGQIRIKVKAAGISPADLALRTGDLQDIPLPPNAVLGFEAAGTVDAVGPTASWKAAMSTSASSSPSSSAGGRAVARPALMGLFSLVTLVAHEHYRHQTTHLAPVQVAAWYKTTTPTFSNRTNLRLAGVKVDMCTVTTMSVTTML